MAKSRVDVVVGVTPRLGRRLEAYRQRLRRERGGAEVSKTDALRVLLTIALDLRMPELAGFQLDNPGLIGITDPDEPGGFVPVREILARRDIGKLERGEVSA